MAAALIEGFQKSMYRRFSMKHYGSAFATHFQFDAGHLVDNLHVQLALLGRLSWWPLYAVATLALIAFAGAYVYALIGRHHRLRARVLDALADDTVIAALGAYGIALLNLALTVVVSHVRVNDYDNRYLTLTNLFGPISGMLTIFLLLKAVVRAPYARYVQPAVWLVALALLVGYFPRPGASAQYYLSETNGPGAGRKGPTRRAPGRLLGHLRVHGAAGRRGDDRGAARRRFHENTVDARRGATGETGDRRLPPPQPDGVGVTPTDAAAISADVPPGRPALVRQRKYTFALYARAR